MIRQTFSLVMGLIFVFAGAIPILKFTILKDFSFELSSLGIFLWIVSALAGLLIVINGFNMNDMDLQGKLRILSIIGGLVLVASSSFLLVVSLGVIALPEQILSLLQSALTAPFLIFGALLIYGTFTSRY